MNFFHWDCCLFLRAFHSVYETISIDGNEARCEWKMIKSVVTIFCMDNARFCCWIIECIWLEDDIAAYHWMRNTNVINKHRPEKKSQREKAIEKQRDIFLFVASILKAQHAKWTCSAFSFYVCSLQFDFVRTLKWWTHHFTVSYFMCDVFFFFYLTSYCRCKQHKHTFDRRIASNCNWMHLAVFSGKESMDVAATGFLFHFFELKRMVCHTHKSIEALSGWKNNNLLRYFSSFIYLFFTFFVDSTIAYRNRAYTIHGQTNKVFALGGMYFFL